MCLSRTFKLIIITCKLCFIFLYKSGSQKEKQNHTNPFIMYSVTRLATVGLDDIIVRVVVTSIMPPLLMIIMQQELNCSSKSFIQSHACKLQNSKNEIGKFPYNQNDVNLGFSRWVYAEKLNKILQPESWSINTFLKFFEAFQSANCCSHFYGNEHENNGM